MHSSQNGANRLVSGKCTKFQECPSPGLASLAYCYFVRTCYHEVYWPLLPTLPLINQSFILLTIRQYGTMIPSMGGMWPGTCRAWAIPNQQTSWSWDLQPGWSGRAGWLPGLPARYTTISPAVEDYSRGCKISRIFWRCYFRLVIFCDGRKCSDPESRALSMQCLQKQN